MIPFTFALALQIGTPTPPPTSRSVAVVVELSPRTDVLAVGNRMGGVHLVEVASGVASRLRGPTASPCSAIAWSADGTSVATREENGRLEVVRVEDRASLWKAESPKPATHDFWMRTSLAFADADSKLVVAGGMPAVQLRGARDGELVAEFGASDGKVTAIALDARRARVAVGTESGSVRLYSTRNGSSVAGPWSVPKPVNALAISPTEDMLAIGAGDALVRLESLTDPRATRTLSYEDMNMWGDLQIGHVAYSEDGKRLLASPFSCWGMRCWTVADGEIFSNYDTWTGGPCSYPAYLVDEGRTMFGGLHGVVRKMREKDPDLNLMPKVWMRFAAAGRFAWTVDGPGTVFEVYDLRDGKCVYSIDITELEGDTVK